MRGRGRQLPELLSVRLSRGTLDKIRANLRADEDGAADFIRTAVERELSERARDRRLETLSTWIV
jgi:hypothetical protein